MTFLLKTFLWGMVLWVIGGCPVDARLAKIWSYQELWDKSDLVAIAEPIANENNHDKMEGWPDSYQGISTTFKVLCCLKGNADGTTVMVRHFNPKDNVATINAGMSVNFLTGPLNGKATYEQKGKVVGVQDFPGNPQWLLFLSKTPNGSFMPVAGPMDPDFSFKEIHGPGAYLKRE